MTKRQILIFAIFLCGIVKTAAQEFFNLTAEQVRIDTLLPHFSYSKDLGYHYSDSVYDVKIEYPEFIDMADDDIDRYRKITDDLPPELPEVNVSVSVSRKRGSLDVSFVPLVFRDGRYKKLVSFMLSFKAQPAKNAVRGVGKSMRYNAPAERYAGHSVLRNGTWAKIRVPASGIYHLSDALIRQAGFSDMSKIRVYGYGGYMQPERLDGDYLAATDDLRQVATYTAGGKRFFYARGPVRWVEGNDRERNPYSDYGYYFITESDGEALTADSAAFFGSFYPAGEDYNTLYEVDDYSWYHSGRNLYDSRVFTVNTPNDYSLDAAGPSAVGRLRVVMTADVSSAAVIHVHDSLAGTITVGTTKDPNGLANRGSVVLDVLNLKPANKITITQTRGGVMRLDYMTLHTDKPRAVPDPTVDDMPVPEYVHRITNQDLHADGPADMVIIIPTTQKMRAQAERLKAIHELNDGMRVRIVPADELYNEFSSGTPDATAYRRYMKMLYDRAATDDDAPKYLLLFGDAAWDNRMLTSTWRNYSPDDFLLSFQSRNSVSKTHSYISDDFFCLLDDGERIFNGTETESVENPDADRYNFRGKPDVAVGRLPVRTPEEASVIIDKIEAYIGNRTASSWQNTTVFLGDDGDNNIHMDGADKTAGTLEARSQSFDIKKIMWDAYKRETSSTGSRYPDVERAVRQYMTDGALLINYTGHGSPVLLSHEQVVKLHDFASTSTANLPLWFTAACDIMPFDGQESNIGETAMLNRNGGAVAFIGTTRTVYANYNEYLNKAFIIEMFGNADENISIGEALRRAKNDMVSPSSGGYSNDYTDNKLHFALLGDPALKLCKPTFAVEIDSIGGKKADGSELVTLKAGQAVTVIAHVKDKGHTLTDFKGVMTATVKDIKETIVCRANETGNTSRAFKYEDRTGIIFHGADSVRDGRIEFSFIIPKDIKYKNGNGQIIIYAVNGDKTKTAHGSNDGFMLNGSVEAAADSIGPSIYCYLNSTAFTNGDNVNPTPHFFAEIYDESGINSSGGGIGHDLELIIDGDMSKTYNLNDCFTYDFGSYKNGTLGYSIPRLEPGRHRLLFRAWDILNNSSVAELTFNVVEGLGPNIINVDCTRNPATTSTSFRIVHDRAGCHVNALIEVFDMSGRLLWTHARDGMQADNTMTIDWDLTIDGGRPLGTGVYLYRVNISGDGSSYTSKAKKLIVISNK